MVYTIKNGLKKAYLAAMKTATTWDALFELGDLVEYALWSIFLSQISINYTMKK